jgi:hypothetical protein
MQVAAPAVLATLHVHTADPFEGWFEYQMTTSGQCKPYPHMHKNRHCGLDDRSHVQIGIMCRQFHWTAYDESMIFRERLISDACGAADVAPSAHGDPFMLSGVSVQGTNATATPGLSQPTPDGAPALLHRNAALHATHATLAPRITAACDHVAVRACPGRHIIQLFRTQPRPSCDRGTRTWNSLPVHLSLLPHARLSTFYTEFDPLKLADKPQCTYSEATGTQRCNADGLAQVGAHTEGSAAHLSDQGDIGSEHAAAQIEPGSASARCAGVGITRLAPGEDVLLDVLPAKCHDVAVATCTCAHGLMAAVVAAVCIDERRPSLEVATGTQEGDTQASLDADATDQAPAARTAVASGSHWVQASVASLDEKSSSSSAAAEAAAARPCADGNTCTGMLSGLMLWVVALEPDGGTQAAEGAANDTVDGSTGMHSAGLLRHVAAGNAAVRQAAEQAAKRPREPATGACLGPPLPGKRSCIGPSGAAVAGAAGNGAAWGCAGLEGGTSEGLGVAPVCVFIDGPEGGHPVELVETVEVVHAGDGAPSYALHCSGSCCSWKCMPSSGEWIGLTCLLITILTIADVRVEDVDNIPNGACQKNSLNQSTVCELSTRQAVR